MRAAEKTEEWSILLAPLVSIVLEVPEHRATLGITFPFWTRADAMLDDGMPVGKQFVLQYLYYHESDC